MNPLGIIGQYTDIVDYCQGQILTVLKLAALPNDHVWPWPLPCVDTREAKRKE